MIKPPRVNKRPANMKQFSELFCNIRRGKDADYEFKFKIIGQLTKDLNAVILSHTRNIKKLQIRISERLPMDLEIDFLLVTAVNYEMMQGFDVGNLEQHALSGIIKDMSAGGIKVQIGELPPRGINKGDVFLFHLPNASLRGNLAVTVLDVLSRRGRNEIHFAFRDTDLLTHMKLNQYLHRKKSKYGGRLIGKILLKNVSKNILWNQPFSFTGNCRRLWFFKNKITSAFR